MSEFVIVTGSRVVPGCPVRVIHVPTGATAPMDPRAPWLEWTDGKVPLAYFATRRQAERWIEGLSAPEGSEPG